MYCDDDDNYDELVVTFLPRLVLCHSGCGMKTLRYQNEQLQQALKAANCH
jgi:hypothetical protein